MAMSSGSMNRIIGPTRPMLGSPLASFPKPPIPPTGVQPVSMKNAVMKPQAMKAAMFGMIMPDRKVPNFWTATRVVPVLLVLAPASAFTAICCLRVEGPRRAYFERRAPSRQSHAAVIVRFAFAPGPAEASSLNQPIAKELKHEGGALLRAAGRPGRGRPRAGGRARRAGDPGPQLLDLRHRRQDPRLRPPQPEPAPGARPRARRRGGRGRRRRRRLVGGRPGAGDRGHPRRH